jgi:predicted nucleic acid-binding protein
MRAEVFVDTNILLYAQSQDPAEEQKRRIAREVLTRPDIGLSAQVLGEFYVNATAKLRPALSHEEAALIVDRLGYLSILPVSHLLVREALRIKAEHAISYWDSLIVAAAKELGCKEISSEDMGHGHLYAGVRVVNPFRRDKA